MPANYRSYGRYLDNSIKAVHSGIERANAINDSYYKEGSIILIANAWELLAKALLIKHSGEQSIYEKGSRRERTITAESAVSKLTSLGYVTELQASPIQQLISMRNEASHQTLPNIPDELLFHLEYYAIRHFKETLDVNFKQYAKLMRSKFLSVSFDAVTTYAESVRKLVARAKKSRKEGDLRLAYLLERGVSFDGSEYIKQSDFNKILLNKKHARPMRNKLKIGEYARNAEMIVVVPIQAPSGTRADINLTKSKGSNISINVTKQGTDDDWPHLTQDLSAKLGKSRNFISKTISNLEMKGDPAFHQPIRTGTKSRTEKYSDKALSYLKNFLDDNPNYDPYKKVFK